MTTDDLSGRDDDVPSGDQGASSQNYTPGPSVAGSSPAPEHPAARKQHLVACEQERDWWDKNKRWAEMLGIALLAVYTGYTVKMYCANKRAADAAQSAAITADKTLRLTGRARINLLSLNPSERIYTKEGKLIVELKDAKYFQVGVPIRNTGPIPATNFILSRFDAVVAEKENAGKPQYHEFLETPHVIPPSTQGFNSDLVVPGTEDVSQEITQLEDGKVWLEFSVLITYGDELGGLHHSEYCTVFNNKLGNWPCPWIVQND